MFDVSTDLTMVTIQFGSHGGSTASCTSARAPASSSAPRCSPRAACRVPAVGEYELRTSLAMPVLDRQGSGGSFTELQALNVVDGVVEMGHDGPALLAIGNTTSRVDFGAHPGDWVDACSTTGLHHHWALGTGHRIADLRAFAELKGLELVEVRV